MNDQQLLELLHQKTPQELTLEEIELLRARLADSPELRETLSQQVQMESYLAAALGRIDVSVEKIVAQQETTPHSGLRSLLNVLGVVCCLLLMAGIVGVFVYALRTSSHEQDPAAAQQSGDGEKSNGGNQDSVPDQPDKPVDPNQPGDTNGQDPPDKEPGAGEDKVVKLPLTIEAEDFKHGNVLVETTDIEGGKLSVVRSEASPSFVEYEFELAESKKLELKLRYASFSSRPLQLTINGRKIDKPVAGHQTGGNLPSAQRWFTIGSFSFVRGKNVIRLETKSLFPLLDQLAIALPDEQVATADKQPPGKEPPGKEPGDDPDNKPDQEPRPAKPWDAIVQQEEPLPRFANAWPEDFDYQQSLPQREDLLHWFAPVEGHPYRISLVRGKHGLCAALDGLARLMSPWPEDGALRLALENYNGLQIHFFHKQQGLSLIYYQGQNDRWAAYVTTREGAAPRPKTFALTATDDDRNRRSQIRFGGPVEIRYREQEVILCRGDIILLRAPLPGPPEEVYFSGHAAFQGIALKRTADFPPPVKPNPLVSQIGNPAEMKWIETIGQEARIEKLDDGGVRLTADKATERGWIAAPLPSEGIHEVIFQVADATAGSGVFLGVKDGQPQEILRFDRNQAGGELCLRKRGSRDDVFQSSFGRISQIELPCVGKQVWIKLLYGAGVVRWWISSDGVHWAAVREPWPASQGGATHIGLHYAVAAPECSITLRSVTLRKLPIFSELAKPEHLTRAKSHADAATLVQWLTRVAATQPADIDRDDWRRACAIRTLAGGCPGPLGEPLVELLLDDAAARDVSPDRQLQLLNEAVLLLNLWDNPTFLQKTLDRYRQIGATAFAQQDQRPFTLTRRALMAAPIATRHAIRVADAGLIRSELLMLLEAGRWQETLDFCRRLRFFQQHQQLTIVDWAESVARRRLPRSAGALPATAHRLDWRHPLEEEFNKQTYNIVAELQAVLESEAYQDAARMITTVKTETLLGVAPHARDRQLLVSMGAAIRLAAQQHPKLKEAMDEEFGEIAGLRVRRAIAAGDIAAVRLACVQFETTEAAAEAHRWLGDRALSSGWFSQALSEYERAKKTAGAGLKAELAARIRLTAAMLGRDAGNSAVENVKLGDVTISAEEFEALVAQMRARHSGSAVSDAGGQAQQRPVPVAPAMFAAAKKGRIDGKIGRQPTVEVTAHVRRYSVPWIERQLATVTEGDTLYVSNRFAVNAFDLKTGQRKWQSASPPGTIMRAQDWTLTPMRPLITHQHIYARLLYGTGPLLVCIDKNSGSVVWSAQQRTKQYLISDPFQLRGRMVALSIVETDQRISVVRLLEIDPHSGETRQQHDLLRLRDQWWTRRICAATALDDTIIANLGGITLCCDVTGRLRWARKQIVLPTDIEPQWVTQYFDPPLHHEGRLYLAQPGVRGLQCVDADSGGMYWSRVLPGLVRLVGVAADRLVVQTEEGVQGLDLKTGKPLWSYQVSNLLCGQLCGGKEGVLISRKAAVPGENNKYRPELIWLDAANGQHRASSELTALENTDPRFGPLLSHQDRLWAFSGNGETDPIRDLVELTPQGQAKATARDADKTDHWLGHVPVKLHQASARVLPQWSLFSGAGSASPGLLPEYAGEKNLLAFSTLPSAPVILVRQVKIPANGKPRLRIRVACAAGQTWNLRLQMGGETLKTEAITAPTGKPPWRDIEIDLSAQAGKSGWLIISGQSSAIATTYFKTLELLY